MATMKAGSKSYLHLMVGVASSLIVIFFYLVYSHLDKILVYGDGITKLNNARRVWDNPVSGFSLAQLGSIWLVGHTALTSTMAWIDPLYRSGLAGSLWSMLAFVLASIMAYDLVATIVRRYHPEGRAGVYGGLAAVLVLSTNLSFIYFAVTPMTESLLLSTQVACAWALVKLEDNLQSQFWLASASIVLAFSAMIRYETWFYAALSAPALAVVFWKNGYKGWDWIIRMIGLYLPVGFVMGCWIVLWEWSLFGDPFYFSNSRYSAHAIDVVGANKTFAVGVWHEAIRQFVLAVRLNIQTIVLVAAGLGLMVFVIQSLASRRLFGLGWVYLIGPVVFFPLSLYLGQNAIDIRDDNVSSLNIRYGVTALPLVAVLVGLLVGLLLAGDLAVKLKRLRVALVIPVVVLLTISQVATWANPATVAPLRDTAAQPSANLEAYAAWLNENYDYGFILAESFGPLNGVQIRTQSIDMDQYVTESNPVLWNDVLDHPEGKVEWVLVTPGDSLDQALVSDQQFMANFDLVYENPFGRIYRTIEHEPLADAGVPIEVRNASIG